MMAKTLWALGTAVLLQLGNLAAQGTNAPLNEDYYHWLTRYEIKAGRLAPEWFTSVRPFKRNALVAFVDSLQTRDNVFTSRADQFNYDYLRNDSWEWSRAETSTSKKPFRKLYQKKSDFAHVDQPDFDLHVSPVLYVGMAKDSRLDEMATINTRGVEIRGMIDKKIGFYTFLTDNQMILPSWAQDQMTLYPVVPHEGFWKNFKNNGVDFFQARAHIDFNLTKHIYMQLGHDRTFIGNGYRSLIFSDYSPPNFFVRANAKVWKLNYLFQLNRLTGNDRGSATGGSSGGKRYPEKYMAFHHASVNIGKKFNLGFFESIVFSPSDSLSGGTFDVGYLNPVIFYRAIEQQFGSSDNALLGLDFKWNAVKGISLYGQFVLDEFVAREFLGKRGWWGNKYAWQLGAKWIDAAGISNFDLQLEANQVRPYTYSHETLSNYSNYSQSLAHPLGANFTEWVGIVRYQPVPKLNITAKAFYARIGRDSTNQNFGSDFLKNYRVRQADYGNYVGQGFNNTVLFADLTASYMLKHNLFIDLKYVVRNSKSDLAFYNNNTSFASIALRWNIAQRTYEY